MRIAICDDDENELNLIMALLNKYRKDNTAMLTYRAFKSGVELLSSTKKDEYSLYLLDAVMPFVDGIATANEIRSYDTEAKIVFITSSPEFAVASYNVKAMDYLLKPVDEKRLFSVLDEVLHNTQKPQEGITVKSQKGMTRILFSKLSYVEIIDKQVYFHLSDGSARVTTGCFRDFEQVLLAREEFVKTHRSYIVNLYQIDKLTQKEITTHQGKSIPISRSLSKGVRDSYIRKLFMGEGI